MMTYQTSKLGEWQKQEMISYTLIASSGYQVSVMNYGATLLEYVTPNHLGEWKNVVVRSRDVFDYIQNAPKWGASIGPVAGRIANGECVVNGKVLHLEKNFRGHHLHGGCTGFDQTFFEVESIENHRVVFYTYRPDAWGNYPGPLHTWITYTLAESGELTIQFRMKSEQDTIVNPTNHSYFNLSGDFTTPIYTSKVMIQATKLAQVDDDGLPTGQLKSPLVMDKLQTGDFIENILQEEPFASKGGIDHPFVLKNGVDWHVKLEDRNAGRQLMMKTDAPALVVYTSNGYDLSTFIEGKKPIRHIGIALEGQVLPDAIHHEHFGTIILRAGEEYFRTMTFYVSPINKS